MTCFYLEVSALKRILIYDNEPAQCDELAGLIGSLCKDAHVLKASTFSQAKELADKQSFYAVFLDIELEDGMNGIALSAELRRNHPDTSLVFVTAHMRYCEEVFESSPDAMLIKPFNERSVRRALDILARRHETDDCITFTTGKNSAQTLRLGDISYIESASRRLTVYNKSYEPIGSFRDLKLSKLAERLPNSFFCCHQSFIVSLSCVTAITRYSFTLSGDRLIPISQSRFKDARQRYFEYVGDTL